jgi:hypothetical protein
VNHPIPPRCSHAFIAFGSFIFLLPLTNGPVLGAGEGRSRRPLPLAAALAGLVAGSLSLRWTPIVGQSGALFKV